MEVISLKPPKDVQDTVERDARRVESFLRYGKIRWSEDRMQKVAADLSKKYEAWRKQTNPLRRKLTRWNDLLEGVVEESNFPFEGASNLTLHYAAGVAASFRSVVNRTLYQDPDIFLARGEAGANRKELDDLQDALNHTFHTETNGLDQLKDGTIPCFRDGTVIVSGTWDRRVERGHDTRIYIKVEEFQRDYPDADTAGVSEEEYQRLLDKFLVIAEMELRVDFNYDFVEHDAPEYELVPLARFVFYPTFAASIRQLELYGRNYFRSEMELKLKAKRGEFYEQAVEQLINRGDKGSPDQWTASRNFIEGVMPYQDEKHPIELADLVYKCDLDDDGIPERYLVTFAPEKRIVLRMEWYPIRRNINNCVAFRFQKREGRLLGVSLMGDTEDLFLFMDSIHNHRNNVRMLATAPIVMANAKFKEQLEPGRTESIIRPGVTFWVDDPDKAMKQLILQNLDQPGNSLDEENLIVRYIELRTGTTQGLSGKETPSDPRAPMGKTLAMINQANLRLDDFIDEYRKGFPELGDLQCALYFQYGPRMLSYTMGKDGKPEQREAPRALFGLNGVRWSMRRRSVTMSPEFSMQRIGGLMQAYRVLVQLIIAGDRVAIEMWNRLVMASGEPDSEKLKVNDTDMMMNAQAQAMRIQAELVSRNGRPPAAAGAGPQQSQLPRQLAAAPGAQ